MVHRYRWRIIFVIFRIGFRIFIRTPHVDAVGDGLTRIGSYVGRYFDHDGSAHSNLSGCREHRRIAISGNSSCPTGYFVARDGHPFTWTLREVDMLTHLDDRRAVVGDG